ncbi:MAG: aminoacyl-tRNA hydrolase [Desulfobacterales bacterium]|nr:aminoacyl-tRNA hydrolase [Desulfobacterales bacterium]
MPPDKTKLIAGLGNPGRKYARTRHNVGFMVVDALAKQYDIELNKKKFDAHFGRGRIGDTDIILVKPMSYMNLSGQPVQQFANFFKIKQGDILVIHDDIDLELRILKIKSKGGHGGHNGVRSLIESLGGGNFIRFRIGVGRSGFGAGVSDHVLGKFEGDELNVLEHIIEQTVEAVTLVLGKGTKEGMNSFNNKRI